MVVSIGDGGGRALCGGGGGGGGGGWRGHCCWGSYVEGEN